MNKKFEQCFAGYGLTVKGNNAYGVVKGYEVNATANTGDMNYPVAVHISCYATEAQRADIAAALKNRKDIKGLKNVTDFGVTLNLTGFTTGAIIKRFPEIVDWVIGMLEANGALGADHCAHCGKPLGASAQKCDFDGMTVTLDGDCVGAVNAAIDKRNADFAAAPNNYLRGFLGALIGGLVGAAIFVALYLLGYVAWISGFAATALGAFLYQKLGGKPNKMMILIVAVTSLVVILVAMFITYIVAAGIEANKLGLYSLSALDAFKICLKDAEFKSAFTYDLLLVIVFTLLGIGFYAWQLFKNVKKAGKQSRVTAQPTSAPVRNDEAQAAQAPVAEEVTESENDQISGGDKSDL